MIVDCPTCNTRTDAEVLAVHEVFNEFDFAPMRYKLLSCSVCSGTQLIEQYLSGYDPAEESHWSKVKRNWPSPELELSINVPEVVRKSIEEARRCLNAKAFMACAVMTGRALEGICRHYKTKSKHLGAGLKELKEKGVIDSKLYAWSKELHIHRNIAAHADEIDINSEDAHDLMDFSIAICEYIFVLNERFVAFQRRKEERENNA